MKEKNRGKCNHRREKNIFVREVGGGISFSDQNIDP
jgi:hypothetical protein